jgi:asparagine synthase (glutamine-hydrolysing)
LDAYLPGLTQNLGQLKRAFTNPFAGLGIHPDFVQQFKKYRPPFPVNTTVNQDLYYDTMVYGLEKLLRFADRNSMAFSREIRLPFLSHNLVEYVFTLPVELKLHEGWTKYVLRKAMHGILPDEVAWRVDKKGFEPPTQKWLRTDLAKERIAAAEQFLIENKILDDKVPYADGWKKIELAYFLGM